MVGAQGSQHLNYQRPNKSGESPAFSCSSRTAPQGHGRRHSLTKGLPESPELPRKLLYTRTADTFTVPWLPASRLFLLCPPPSHQPVDAPHLPGGFVASPGAALTSLPSSPFPWSKLPPTHSALHPAAPTLFPQTHQAFHLPGSRTRSHFCPN